MTLKEKLSPYFPGLLLFALFMIIGLLTFKDYGIAWDEPLQRGPGVLSYNYMFHGDKELLQKPTDNHGAGYEIPLVIIEKAMHLKDTRDIYLMRHIVTHTLFLLSALAMYILGLRLFRNKYLASFAFLLIACAPRLYAHSYFNSKDLPFLSMFIISLAFCRLAFAKNKPLYFLVLGLLVGYSTSIRIMGIMLFLFILGMLLIDLINDLIKKEKPTRTLLNIVLYIVGSCFLLVLAWPYLWKNPVHNFLESFSKLSRFELWKGSILMHGKYIDSVSLPWTYFPTWFLISNPVLWLIAGFTGLVLIIREFFKRPKDFMQNTNERNFLLYPACFLTPIFAVIILHSIIYDDWRHLYFIYPSFILMGLYAVNRLLESDFVKDHKYYPRVVLGICGLQILLTGVFMVQAHPFQQVYFNQLVSHDDEFLRKNYEMDYWGVSNYQALRYILNNDESKKIFVTTIYPEILQNNIDMLEDDDRNRLQLVHPDSSEYFITNFRFHPDDFEFQEEYSYKVLNSTVIRVYRQRPHNYFKK
jgi:hypothetical protein